MSLRIGIVGAGRIVQFAHLPGLIQIGGVKTVAIADADIQVAERVATAYGIPHVYDNAAALINGESNLDGVVVATPQASHAEACLPALERGIPVFLEKPLESTLEKAREIVSARQRHGTIMVVGYNKRFDPAYVAASALIRSGELGEIRYARVHEFGGFWMAGALTVGQASLEEEPQPPGSPQKLDNRATRKYSFEFEWLEGWIHDVNMARGLFGEAKSIQFVSNNIPRLALVDFEQAHVLFEVGLLAYPGSPFDQKVNVFTSTGRLDLEFRAPMVFRQPTVLRIAKREGMTIPHLEYKESFTEEMVHFLRCIAGKEQSRTTAEDAIRDLELCLEIIQAGRH